MGPLNEEDLEVIVIETVQPKDHAVNRQGGPGILIGEWHTSLALQG
jgi:hypothetical protein